MIAPMQKIVKWNGEMFMVQIYPYCWKQYAGERQIVVWGTGADAPYAVSNIFVNAGIDISFFVSRDWMDAPQYMGKRVWGKDVLDKTKHYVVIGTTKYQKEVYAELHALGFSIQDDFAVTYWPGDHKHDRWINGIFIGKQSYYPNDWNEYIEPRIGGIGRYTSINETARLEFDHSLIALTTSTLIWQIIDSDKMGLLLKERPLTRPNRVKIGNDVWIGANTFINSSKVKEIGDGAIIGSGAVVLEDVPPYAVVVGVPGKIKRYRYTPEQIECLLRVQWWNWSDEELRENAELIFYPNKFFERFM